MLGWFKKTFGKKADQAPPPVAPPAVEPPEILEEHLPLPVEGLQAVPADEAGAAAPSLPVPEPQAAEEGGPEIAGPETPVAEPFPVATPDPVPEAAGSAESAEPVTPAAAVPEADDTVTLPEEGLMGPDVREPVAEAAEVEEPAAEAGEPPEQAPAPPIEAAAEEEPVAVPQQEKPPAKSMLRRLQERLSKTRDSLVYRLDRLFLGKKEIDQDLFDQLEEILITADLGVRTTRELLDHARKKIKRDQLSDPQALKAILREQLLAFIQASEQPAELVMPAEGPFVIMVVGVNGVGKTTTIGKIAAKFVRSGQSVLLVAGDTFRAAAIGQLKIWGERVGVEVIAQNPGADPSSVVFDGLEYGVAHRHDVILIDTAGRLHTSVNLMEELKKIKRVIGKKLAGAPHEVMLVLDATTGQNGISQAKLFHEAVTVTGLTLTKLDGTAKGGIVANVCRETGIPVRFIGIGEQLDDLRDFDAREFVDALFARDLT